jgi:DNA-binding helix-hairpin-helix protein with protein kinase domain
MKAKVPPEVRASGYFVSLGKELGCGGEGAVYEVSNRPDVVAKIYHKPITSEKASKIELMTSMKSESLLSLTAWPVELLRTKGGSPCGLLMPRVSGHKDIHNLFSPKSRKVEFPNADWRFLIRTAANTARAFAVIHDTGCVIGDVNHGSIIVSSKATVRLIDCDSFQVTSGGQRFLCEVGVPDFTPPELQGKSFKGVVRSQNHDNFGLAILVFRLLFMGRHPFAGRFLGRGEMPIEKAILEFRFPYGNRRTAVQMEPPPNTPEITTASIAIAQLLERAFARDSVKAARPRAIEWIDVLEKLEKQVTQCKANASHFFFNGLKNCPWCNVEKSTGIILFNSYIIYGNRSAAVFDISVAWNKIVTIPSLPPSPTLIDRQGLGAIRPCKEAIDAGGNPSLRTVGVIIVCITVISMCVLFPKVWLLWLGGGAILGQAVGRKKVNSPALTHFTNKYRGAEAQYRTIKERWDIEASSHRMTEKIRELEGFKNQLRDIPSLRQRRYRELEHAREKAQLRRFLERFTISKATISGIGPGRKSMLESYNVETAWDITNNNVSRVPGFGPALTNKLIEWRRNVERKFRFDHSKGVDPSDIAALDRNLAELKRKFEQRLIAGPNELTQIRNQIIAQRNALEQQVNDAYQAMVQAEVDMKAAKA